MRKEPRILTLDEALALAEDYDDALKLYQGRIGKQTVEEVAAKAGLTVEARIRRWAAHEAMEAIRERISCKVRRFIDPHLLSRGEYMAHAAWWLMAEVQNGGFHQYLSNSTGEDGEALKHFLSECGSVEITGLLTRVSRIFPGGRIPEDREERNDCLDAYEADHPDWRGFNDEDRAFYRNVEDMDELVLGYVRSHRQEFLQPDDEIVRVCQGEASAIREMLGVPDDSAAMLAYMEEGLAEMQAMLEKLDGESKAGKGDEAEKT